MDAPPAVGVVAGPWTAGAPPGAVMVPVTRSGPVTSTCSDPLVEPGRSVGRPLPPVGGTAARGCSPALRNVSSARAKGASDALPVWTTRLLVVLLVNVMETVPAAGACAPG